MKTKVKGLPTAVVQSGKYVQIWCSSPDGDSSDSQILEIRCANDTQATVVYEAWCEMVWADDSPARLGVKWHDSALEIN